MTEAPSCQRGFMTDHRNAPSRQLDTVPMREIVTAIMVDGGFYRRRARRLFGEKTAAERPDELMAYCRRHIRESRSHLYRIYYYDCPPSDRVIFHPLTRQHVNLAKTDEHSWMTEFLETIVRKRKVALRRGEELETQQGYSLKPTPLKKLCHGTITIADLTEQDFTLDITQKGVDMRIGLDIASLAERRAVNQIIMISGDSDFVPAAKHARREGIDFILDPLWAPVAKSLNEHVDGVRECVRQDPANRLDPLHVDNLRSESPDEPGDAEPEEL